MFFFAHEKFLLQPLVQPQGIVCIICCGQAWRVDCTGIKYPLSTVHPQSSRGSTFELQMWALLSIAVANAARLRCCSYALSMGGIGASAELTCCSEMCALVACRDGLLRTYHHCWHKLRPPAHLPALQLVQWSERDLGLHRRSLQMLVCLFAWSC